MIFVPLSVPAMWGKEAPSLRTTRSAVKSADAMAPAFEAANPIAASAGKRLSVLSVAAPNRLGSVGDAGFGINRPRQVASAPASEIVH